MIGTLALAIVLAAPPQPLAPPAWPPALTALVFTSKSGASVSVARLLQYVAPPEPDEPHAFTDIRTDDRSQLVEACSVPCRQAGSGFVLIVPARDFPPPRGATVATVHDTSIGLSYVALMRGIHADTYLASKEVIRASNGDVIMIELTDQDPPPSRYDHGWRATIYNAYALRDGVVVAHAYHYTEN